MAESRTNNDRKHKVDAFKQKEKQAAKQEARPRTYLIPNTTWESKENLDFRGDLADAMEHQMMLTFQALQESKRQLNEAAQEFQKMAHVMQMIIQQNIKAGKIKLNYVWDNGDPATDEDVATYESKMNELRELQKKAFEENRKKENGEKTGLVGLDGQPIGTTQSLDENLDQEEEKNLEAIVDQYKLMLPPNDEQPSNNENANSEE